jgi:hypothetical protein
LRVLDQIGGMIRVRRLKNDDRKKEKTGNNNIDQPNATHIVNRVEQVKKM